MEQPENLVNRIKAAGVPTWVTVLAILIAAVGTIIGAVSLLNPSTAEVPSYFERAYGGRNIAIAVALGVAVVLRSRAAYLAGFAGGLFREIGDIASGFDQGENRSVIVGAVFLSLGLAALAHIVTTGSEPSESRRPDPHL
ncbi:MAG: hypothetical protein HKN24_02890 [Acidimicrobiales bacterium]|nr:hypothetical protein [Acidimicrobiales bacterium]